MCAFAHSCVCMVRTVRIRTKYILVGPHQVKGLKGGLRLGVRVKVIDFRSWWGGRRHVISKTVFLNIQVQTFVCVGACVCDLGLVLKWGVRSVSV